MFIHLTCILSYLTNLSANGFIILLFCSAMCTVHYYSARLTQQFSKFIYTIHPNLSDNYSKPTFYFIAEIMRQTNLF